MSMRQRSSKSSPTGEKFDEDNGHDERKIKYTKISKKNGISVTLQVFFVGFIGLALVTMTFMKGGTFSGLRVNFQPKIILTAKAVDKFTRTPEQSKRTYWVEKNKKINEPIIRAFRDRKWIKVNNYEEAQFLWTYSPDTSFFKSLKPWQRYNHLTGFSHWNNKDTYVEGFKDYEARVPGKDHYFNPETYRLVNEEERQQLHHVLTKEGGMNRPWVLKQGNVNQGKGITIMAPHSNDLANVLEDNPIEEYETEQLIMQRYVCNELTWDRRKYDVRMFWLIASVDPLLVLYHDGYVRIGNSNYDETDFSNTRAHLTTHTRLAEEGKATWKEFEEHVFNHNRAAGLGISDPVSHVRNQFKEAIAETAAAFKDTSFNSKKMVEENGIAFYGADFILDQDLDAYYLEPQMGCGLDEDYNFRIEMHDQMFRTMVDILGEILEKEEKGDNLLPLNKIGKWQVVYADGWTYNYDGYKRSKQKKDCSLPNKG
mmetsp:Transcript_27101/g.41190  ORF Transcript_27101/g.41190 Transcript_27101/m.41190 type:complete len:483 (-) Transcript_27101:1539-2987(-)|eukprot:CAMPEP_0194231738 /NCGR_PEP_ID=MMETSP0158-20130606/364_1 /TAXON_ID=33649 /ORGANISM="Thalassionema nitzschioides, Strain L26-B" /LENGTH=482 /DNA_ID=CAMNT_0038964407 /DNA_START=73 /DNA_END=1521 /DNA_ORIENTATION=+